MSLLSRRILTSSSSKFWATAPGVSLRSAEGTTPFVAATMMMATLTAAGIVVYSSSLSASHSQEEWSTAVTTTYNKNDWLLHALSRPTSFPFASFSPLSTRCDPHEKTRSVTLLATSSIIPTEPSTSTSTLSTTTDDDDDDEDEPTSCIMCLANRRPGPCRKLWRKVERCLKENPHTPSDEDDSLKQESVASSGVCDEYMWPWMMCTRDYRNLYLTYFNQVYQEEFIDPMEKEIQPHERARFSSFTMDWEPLTLYYKEHWGEIVERFAAQRRLLVSEESGSSTSIDEDIPNTDEAVGCESNEISSEWLEPDLVQLTVKIPLRDAHTGMLAQVAYAKDQSGTVVGSDVFVSKKNEDDTQGILHIALQPDKNRTLQIYALYKRNDEAVLYESYPVVPLLEAMPTGKRAYKLV